MVDLRVPLPYRRKQKILKVVLENIRKELTETMLKHVKDS